jgi:hypothetical protein
LNRRIPRLRAQAKILCLIHRAAARIEDGFPEIERIMELARKPGPERMLARKFFDALRTTRNDLEDCSKIDWTEFVHLLYPRSRIDRKNECRARASEIDAEWLRYIHDLAPQVDEFSEWVTSLGLPTSRLPKAFAGDVLRSKLNQKRHLARKRKAKQRANSRPLSVTDQQSDI